MPPFFIKINQGAVYKPEKLSHCSNIWIVFVPHEVIIDVPFPAIDLLFFRKQNDFIEISNDLRILYSPDLELDERGLFSLIQFGAVVPPLTIFKNVNAFVPGFRYVIKLSDLSVSSYPKQTWSPVTDSDGLMTIDEQAKLVSEKIRKRLTDVSSDRAPVVLFSGGVDSGVLAAELAKMGFLQTKLIHYSFGTDDAETILARSMAVRLNLQFEIIEDARLDKYDVLNFAAINYPFPFCDHSCLPTYGLAQGVMRKAHPSQLIIDGTGADGAFGLFGRAASFKKLYTIPKGVRSLLGRGYKSLEMWQRGSTLEYYLRLLKRSSDFPLLCNSIAQHPLLNVGYFASDAVVKSVNTTLLDWVDAITPSPDLQCMLPLLDMALVCCGIFAHKGKSLLEANGFSIEYPFLSHDIIDLAIQHARFWPGSLEMPKHALKHLLATSVPDEFVYRKKSAFVSPVVHDFSASQFLQHLDSVRSAKSSLREFVHIDMVEKSLDLLRDKKPLSSQTYNFLWAIVFVNCWLSQLKDASEIVRNNLQQDMSIFG